ncbi:MAG: hypothetical protein WBG95_05940 [Sulfitobacter sp.]
MTIKTARDYFEQVISFNLTQYDERPSSLPAAYNLANALFSMHEWVWETYEEKLEAELGIILSSKSAFNHHIQTACPAFRYMRDLANASKHVSLHSASTQAKHISDTSAIESKWGEGVWGVSKYGRGVVVIDDDGTKVDFENSAKEVHEYWFKMLAKLS